MTEKEISLQEALHDLGLPSLPKETPASAYMNVIEGVALVSKINGAQNYAIVVSDGEGQLYVRKDYGLSAMIRSIDKVYAKSMIDAKSYSPDLRSDKQIMQFLKRRSYEEEEISKLLSKEDKTPEEIKRDRDTIKAYISKECVAIAKENIAEDNRINQIKGYAQRIKNGKEEG